MRTFFLLLILSLPMVTHGAGPKNFSELVGMFLSLIGLLIPVLFGLSLIVFLWGIIKAWILGGGDETSVTKGKQLALAGMLGLVVMAGVWGIVALVRGSLF